MLRFTTAGESHGPALVAILEGMPAGVPLLAPTWTRNSRAGSRATAAAGACRSRPIAVEFLSGVRAG